MSEEYYVGFVITMPLVFPLRAYLLCGLLRIRGRFPAVVYGTTDDMEAV